ncbi:MAG: sugar phosphate isomerase/epimerase [Terracidiphilus sp.]|jgi:sugar phosphate isomerase/epimerase
MTTRREFIAGVSAALIASGTPAQAEARKLSIGLELYSFRADMKRDVPGTLAKARAMGFDRIETGSDYYGYTAPEFKSLLDAAGLKATSIHFVYDILKKGTDKARRDLDVLGAHWVVAPWIPHGKNFERADAERAIDDFNAWGEALAKDGKGFAYHTHGYEFAAAPETTLFDVLAHSTNPATVSFQMDTFWIVVPGQDCAALLQRYPGRFRLMHLKDLRKGAPIGSQQGHADDKDSVPVGEGIIPWGKVLALARQQGCEEYFIEDESPDAMTQVPISLKYLNSRKW